MFIDIAILGATGLVGQKIIALLMNHPFFRIKEIIASNKRQGKLFRDECLWIEPLCALDHEIGSMKFKRCEDIESPFVVSCLPAHVAQEKEVFLAQAGKMVFSNASSFRLHPTIPLIVPEINASHIHLINLQPTSGKIIKNPNCSAVGVALAIAPLLELASIELLNIVTLQSVSGAGYLGVSCIDILGNTIPYINGEEEKIVTETQRLLHKDEGNCVHSILAQVHRVPVVVGHTLSLQVCFNQDVSLSDVVNCYELWNRRHNDLFVLYKEPGRPQARKDLRDDDMRVHIGHFKLGQQANHLNMVVLINNLVRGAAGAIIANMENFIEFQQSMQLCQKT